MRYIYGLVDPRNGQYFYVGQTKNPENRMKTHRTEGHCTINPHDVHTYIYNLRQKGYALKMEIIEEVPNGLAYRVEWEWALTLKLLGHPITNRLTHMVKGTSEYVKQELAKLAA